MIAIAVCLVVVLAAIGYGDSGARVLRLDFDSRLERISVDFGLGAGFLAALIFWAGVLSWFYRAVFLVLLIPGAVLGARTLWQNLRSGGAHARVQSTRTERLILVALAICAVANVMGSLAPPTFADALIYHLYVPQQHLIRHRIFDMPALWQTYQPMSIEMLNAAAMSLGSVKAVAVLGATFGLFAAAATALLARRLSGTLVASVAALMFYANAMIAWESTSCLIEIGIAALGALGVHALLRWDDTQQRGWFVAAALLAGFAAASKLNAAAFIIAGGVLVLYLRVRGGDTVGRAVEQALLFGALASLPALPWFIRSLILTGNPVFPFVTNLFGDNPDRVGIQWAFNQMGVGYSLVDRLLAPWHLLSRGAAFDNAQHLSPLPFLMAPVILLRMRGDHRRTALVCATGVLFGIWVAGAHVARYLIPIQPFACVLAADALCWLASFGGRRRFIAAVTGTLFLSFGLVNTILYNKQFVPVVLGLESESQYLGRASWFYDVFREVSTTLPRGGRILVNAQQPVFHLDYPNAVARESDFEDASRLRRIIADGGFTHILILGKPHLEAKIAELVPDVAKVWRRDVDVVVSRSFHGFGRVSVALFEVRSRPTINEQGQRSPVR